MSRVEERRRRWFVFTLRELLLITTITGLGIGWYLDRSRLVHSEEFRVGQGIVSTVQMLYADDAHEDPLPVHFRRSFTQRPFLAKLSISEYYADYPEERRPASLAILPLSP